MNTGGTCFRRVEALQGARILAKGTRENGCCGRDPIKLSKMRRELLIAGYIRLILPRQAQEDIRPVS